MGSEKEGKRDGETGRGDKRGRALLPGRGWGRAREGMTDV